MTSRDPLGIELGLVRCFPRSSELGAGANSNRSLGLLPLSPDTPAPAFKNFFKTRPRGQRKPSLISMFPTVAHLPITAQHDHLRSGECSSCHMQPGPEIDCGHTCAFVHACYSVGRPAGQSFPAARTLTAKSTVLVLMVTRRSARSQMASSRDPCRPRLLRRPESLNGHERTTRGWRTPSLDSWSLTATPRLQDVKASYRTRSLTPDISD